MRIKDRLSNFINDSEPKITIYKMAVNIVNYIEIMDFNAKEVRIKSKDGECIIRGKNLLITKFVDSEVLIEGDILEVIPFC